MRRCVALIVVLIALASRLDAQRLSVETLIDVEGWKTDAGSRLLALNGGDPMLAARLHGWVAYRVRSDVELLGVGYLEGESAKGSEVEHDVELLEARWLHSRAISVEAGKILMPVGDFGPRRFSNTNPLIGEPDTYVARYAWGAEAKGAVGRFDYLATLIATPAVNLRYTPEPGARLRPVLGVGLSSGPQFRIGAVVTRGSYLGPDQSSKMPSGKAWQDFSQSVLAVDARYTFNYFEARVEAAWSSYEVPTVTDAVHGLGWSGEARATLSPRIFVAGRFEHNRYPFVLPVNPGFWVGVATTQMNGEVGVGYRLNADALVKTSIRKDHWPVHEAPGTDFPDGYAVAVQFSLHTDIGELLRRRP